jgi:hypothetical protein
MIFRKLALSAIALFFLCSCRPATAAGAPTAEKEKPTNTLTPQSRMTQGASGTLIRNGDLILFINGWREVEPDVFYTPEAGIRTVEVDALVVNQGRVCVKFYMEFFSLMDSQGRKYTEPRSFSPPEIGGSMWDGFVFPGDRFRMKVGFEVRQDASGFRLSLDLPDWWLEEYPVRAEKSVFVDLDPRPGAGVVPASIDGEIPFPAIPLDEKSRTCGPWTIQIRDFQFRQPNEIIRAMAGSRSIEAVLTDIAITLSEGEEVRPAVDSFFWIQDWSGNRFPAIALGNVYGYGYTFPTFSLPGEEMESWIGFLIPLPDEGSVMVFNCGDSDRIHWRIPQIPAP